MIQLEENLLPLLKLFAETLPPFGVGRKARIFDLALGSKGISKNAELFHWDGTALAPDKDLRMLSLTGDQKESFDGLWAAATLDRFSVEEIQRILQIYFSALKPKSGLLALSWETRKELPPNAIEATLRQSGFRSLKEGKMGALTLYLGQRL